MTSGMNIFGVRRFVAALGALLAWRQSRTACERFGRSAGFPGVHRRQVACRKRGQIRALQSGFTLIELILVMALLAVVLAVSAPSLSRFFKGRNLDSEARRFMSLTRAAQSRAVSEGVPMVLWIETKLRAYGLNADKSFVETDTKAEQFKLDDSLEVEVRYSADAIATNQTVQFKNEKLDTGTLYTLRFNPDGFVSPGSPEVIVFRQKDDGELWVAQSRSRLNYEIQSAHSLASR